jgi:hypothetical protein
MGANKRSISLKVSGKERVTPYVILRFIAREFGFGLLLLIFALGSLSVGVSLQHFRAVKSMDIRSQAMEVCPVLPAPSKVTARAGQHEGELLVQWQPVSEATGYRLRVESQFDRDDSAVVPVKGNTNEMAVRGLVPGELYKVQIASESACGVGEESGIIMGLARVGGDSYTDTGWGDFGEVAVVGGLEQRGVDVSRLWGRANPLKIQAQEAVDWDAVFRHALYENGVLFMVGGLILFFNALWLALYGIWGVKRGVERVANSTLGFGR